MAYRILIVLMLLSGVTVTLSVTASQTVPPGYIRVAVAHGVPPEVLYSVSMTETVMAPRAIAAVMKQVRTQTLPLVSRPWPWTINVAGRGYRYASRLEAWQALQIFIRRYPTRRIDVGIAQVNLGWNGHRFRSTWVAFDPWINLNVAASILRECWDRHPGSWLAAAGCYHHPAGGNAASRYQKTVKRHLTQLNASSSGPQAVAAIIPGPDLVWTQPVSEIP